jgi:hypothetical protein
MGLDPQTADRLIKLLGMLGSVHAGERAVAGLKASQLLRERGLQWRDVIHAPIADHTNFYGAQTETTEEDWEPTRRFCLQRARALTPKELGFLINIADWNGPLTERQQNWLNNIYARLRREAA